MRQRVSGSAASTCALFDKTQHPVNATVTVAGNTYRCVTVLDENLNRTGAAWTPVSSEPATGR